MKHPSIDNQAASLRSFGQLSVSLSSDGDYTVLLLGYPLLLSNSEVYLLHTLLLSLPDHPHTDEISENTGISPEQIPVLVNRINRKASAISGRRLILGVSHQGYRINPCM